MEKTIIERLRDRLSEDACLYGPNLLTYNSALQYATLRSGELSTLDFSDVETLEANGPPSKVIESCLNLATSVDFIMSKKVHFEGSEISLRVAWTIERALDGLLESATGAISGADRLGETDVGDAIGRAKHMIQVARDIVDARIGLGEVSLYNDLTSGVGEPLDTGCARVNWSLLAVTLALAVDVCAFVENQVDNRRIQEMSLGLLDRLKKDEDFWSVTDTPDSFAYVGGIIGMARADTHSNPWMVETSTNFPMVNGPGDIQ